MYWILFLNPEGHKYDAFRVPKDNVTWIIGRGPVNIHPSKGTLNTFDLKDLIAVFDADEYTEEYRMEEFHDQELWGILMETLYKEGHADWEVLQYHIRENSNSGYETAILSTIRGVAVKYGSLISDQSELPDEPHLCSLLIWNNSNIEVVLGDYKIIDSQEF